MCFKTLTFKRSYANFYVLFQLYVQNALNVHLKLNQVDQSGTVVMFGWGPFEFPEVPTIWKLIVEEKLIK